MFTQDSIPKNDRIREPVTVTVVDITHPSASKRDVELIVEDSEGNELPLIIWSTHNVDQNWKTNHQYELRNVRGKWWNSNGKKQYELSSTSDLAVTELGTDSLSKLVVLGDTHIGYRHRNRSEKPRWARGIDGRNPFQEALNIAKQIDATAIIHAGDVFDHEAIESDCTTVTDALVNSLQAEIPFFYVRGNHDTDEGIYSLRKLASQNDQRFRLDGTPITIGDSSANIFGTDYDGGDSLSVTIEESASTVLHPNVLVIHETPYPVVDDDGNLLYDAADAVNLASFLRDSPVEFDLIICGHMHVSNRGVVRGHDVPVVVTGPTIPISKYEKESQPSVWIVEVSPSDINSITRRPLSRSNS